jgi:hypothetical protein
MVGDADAKMTMLKDPKKVKLGGVWASPKKVLKLETKIYVNMLLQGRRPYSHLKSLTRSSL